jgi:hypothetical protein
VICIGYLIPLLNANQGCFHWLSEALAPLTLQEILYTLGCSGKSSQKAST